MLELGPTWSVLPPMVLFRHLRILFVVALLAAVVLVGCRRQEVVTAEVVLFPLVTDKSTDLTFTWIDDNGELHIGKKVADVPAGAREVVRVADPLKAPPKLDDVFVADLRTPDADGVYAVRIMTRIDFEAIAVERQNNPRVPGANGPDSTLAANARPTVIIYGASWCGPCHQAAAYLKRRGIPFIERDIEEDGTAASEMQEKLSRAGMRGGAIPVIDVRGKVLVGFDQAAVDRALGQ